MKRLSAFTSESPQAAFTAAEYCSFFRKFRQSALTHGGGSFRAEGMEHVKVTAANGIGAGMLRLAVITAADSQQFPNGFLLFWISLGGAGIVPDVRASGRNTVFWAELFCQHGPDGLNIKAT